MALTDKLTAIADAIRSKGGTTDQLTLTGMVDAINAIQTGSGVTGLAYDMGEFVLEEDIAVVYGTYHINHNLGETPGFVLVWTDDFVGITNPDTTYLTSLGFVWLNQIMGLENWLTASVSGIGTTVNFNQNRSSSGMSVVKPNSSTYTINPDMVTSEYFTLSKTGSKEKYRAGAVYKYFVSKAWWNIGGVASAG